jgi:hypothetical protein
MLFYLPSSTFLVSSCNVNYNNIFWLLIWFYIRNRNKFQGTFKNGTHVIVIHKKVEHTSIYSLGQISHPKVMISVHGVNFAES